MTDKTFFDWLKDIPEDEARALLEEYKRVSSRLSPARFFAEKKAAEPAPQPPGEQERLQGYYRELQALSRRGTTPPMVEKLQKKWGVK